MKSHGGADALAFRYALKKAYVEVTHGILERIAQRVAAVHVPAPAIVATPGAIDAEAH